MSLNHPVRYLARLFFAYSRVKFRKQQSYFHYGNRPAIAGRRFHRQRTFAFLRLTKLLSVFECVMDIRIR